MTVEALEMQMQIMENNSLMHKIDKKAGTGTKAIAVTAMVVGSLALISTVAEWFGLNTLRQDICDIDEDIEVIDEDLDDIAQKSECKRHNHRRHRRY